MTKPVISAVRASARTGVAEGTGATNDVIDTGWVGDVVANWTYEPCYMAEGEDRPTERMGGVAAPTHRP